MSVFCKKEIGVPMTSEGCAQGAIEVIGFDARTLAADSLKLWSRDRRNLYLLRESQRPLSVDPLVWPSLDELESSGLDGKLARCSAFKGTNQNLWDELAVLNRNIERIKDFSTQAFQTVAVTWHPPASTAATAIGPAIGFANPNSIESGWLLLGYDVADGSLISGLSNCGYTPDERSHLAPVWADRLNRFHLFASLDSARTFRDISDTRIPEHAPFHVYGLWAVTGISVYYYEDTIQGLERDGIGVLREAPRGPG